ncbi:MAG TPA: HPr family phosphocarrier protein [Planctomycetota bacterium]|mgnify:CR=1 FL=1|nr:HPr family phosphocarrier protein [Planctomycetota bacterium]
MTRVERTVTVINTQGLHARPSALVVKTAVRFRSELRLCREGSTADAKSMIEVMMLACPKGSVLKVCADGVDASAALDAIDALFRSGFDEAYG